MTTRCRSRMPIVVLGLLLAAPAWAAPVSLPLAEKGKALQPIVISEKASAEIKQVAAELVDYLGRITGAKFEVKAGDGSTGIVLGTLEEFPNPALKEGLAIRNTYDGKEAFAIRTEAKRLLLIGATDLGTSHAAFRFLEAIGCRWFFPAKEWEVVPSQPALTVAIEETDRPRVLVRVFGPGFGFFRDGKGPPKCFTDYMAWRKHNRMETSFTPFYSHAWQGIIADNKKTFAAHPEYLALVKGKRQGDQLCVSNPELRKLCVDYALEYFKKYPKRDMVSMETSDGTGHCECAECKKLGSLSNRVFGLANEVAREVDRKYPGKMVGVYAYSEHSDPPDFRMEPNVHVQLTAGFNFGRYSHEQLLELWPKVAPNFGGHLYISLWGWDADKLPGGLAADLTEFQKILRKHGPIRSLHMECSNNWGPHGRGYYAISKLLWNPDVNVSQVLADFYDKAFGPAAPAMKRYYERIAPDSHPLLSKGLIGEAFKDVEEATKLARDHPDVLARLDDIKHYLRYVHLRWQFDHEKVVARKKEHFVAAMTLGYRTRYEYMNHWMAMLRNWSQTAGKELNEPTWSFYSKGSKPWEVDKPVTREETEAWFREGQKYFPARSVEEMRFSDDLVYVPFHDAKPRPTSHIMRGAADYFLWSRTGEALKLQITPGLIPGAFRDRPDATYALKDSQGKVVAEGTMKLEPTKQYLALNVPKAGLYYLDFKDSGAGWRIEVEAGKSVTLLTRRDRPFTRSATMQETFFYVPRGTRVLHYFWRGGPHKVLGPDQKPLRDIQTTDDIVSIAVPPAFAGTVWSLSSRAHGHLWFFNAPNCLAASPSGLLLPRELARKDRLIK